MNTKLNTKHNNNTKLYNALGTVIYVAIVAMGKHEDYYENSIFCSTDKTKVEKWVNRLNKIIEDNTERIKKYNDYTKEQPYWYDYINWEFPLALIREIPIR